MTLRVLTPDQSEFIEKTRKARERCAGMAALANKLNLPIMAREWDYLGNCLQNALAMQTRFVRQAVEPSATLPENAAPAGPQTEKTETVEHQRDLEWLDQQTLENLRREP